MNQFEVIAQPRADLGKGASRRLRRSGQVPAVLYGAGKEAVGLILEHKDLVKHLESEAFYSHILTIQIGGQTERAVLRDLQRHPYRPVVMHADFLRVDESKKLHMHIPVHFINEDVCVAVKTGGGAISHQMVEVVVECLPKDLPEFIEVDLANVEAGQVIHLSDLKLPEGVEIPALRLGAEHDLPVVGVYKGRANASMEEETAASAAVTAVEQSPAAE